VEVGLQSEANLEKAQDYLKNKLKTKGLGAWLKYSCEALSSIPSTTKHQTKTKKEIQH
jgi:hypothetical protein